jgi:hypothetical protein
MGCPASGSLLENFRNCVVFRNGKFNVVEVCLLAWCDTVYAGMASHFCMVDSMNRSNVECSDLVQAPSILCWGCKEIQMEAHAHLFCQSPHPNLGHGLSFVILFILCLN